MNRQHKYDAPERLRSAIDRMRVISLAALNRMYLPDEQMFCFCVRRTSSGDNVEGVSRRYTAIVLIGMAAQRESLDEQILGNHSASSVCGRLISDVSQVDNLGDVALTVWAAAALNHEQIAPAIERLVQLDPVAGSHPTVEIAWALTALTLASKQGADAGVRDKVAARLLGSFSEKAELFPHWPAGCTAGGWRSHVSCFADWVYPVQALSHYHILTGDEASLRAARRAARNMCGLQGAAGQWWWHFDSRTGRVIERYPVYSVHQDSMAPMAFFDLQEACGDDFGEAVSVGVDWLLSSPERGDSLIDDDAGLIWRKVCRKEPGKLSRGLQAASSAVHSSLRMPGANLLFPPRAVDYECRPYHLGWLLYAFSDQNLAWV